ncbi:SGNH hydrolase [Vararia minispora EC-137]|uniref:SGNH hydrolase n=1 Tax=Vararia minispora EC-137 TaxID=1314806 RepID=A0ACB8QE47_9AGAM|nr:SGNH hydrolase [Vararia minispora EC-137]
MGKLLETVCLFGDSLTQGAWELNGLGARMAHVYARRFDVLNRGFSGYNTEWALPLLAEVLPPSPPRLLTIWFGANDACILPSPQHVPLSRFKENLRAMIHAAPDSTRVLLLSPPPVNTHQRAADLASRTPPKELDRLFDVTKSYAEAVKVVATEENVPIADVWTAVWDAAGRDEAALSAFLYDGLHLNEAGYKVTYDVVADAIAAKWPELRLEHSWRNYKYPTWDWFIDHKPGDTDGWEEHTRRP